jgi:hypothetical protein
VRPLPPRRTWGFRGGDASGRHRTRATKGYQPDDVLGYYCEGRELHVDGRPYYVEAIVCSMNERQRSITAWLNCSHDCKGDPQKRVHTWTSSREDKEVLRLRHKLAQIQAAVDSPDE